MLSWPGSWGRLGRLDGEAAIVAIILTSFALRAVLAATTGFSFDESYDVVAARTVALGYFDHPPLTMWLIAGAVRLFGTESNFVVRLPTMLLFAGTTWFIYRLSSHLFTRAAGIAAALTLNLSPLFGVFAGTIALTDGPLLFALAAAGYYLARATFDERATRRHWLLAGLFFGVAALAKYSAFLLAPGVLLFLVSVPHCRQWLRRPDPYLSAGTALLLFSPVILWNYAHGWASFAFQGKRAAFDGGIHLIRLAEYFGIIALIVLPTIWAGLFLSLTSALRQGPSDDRRWFLTCLAMVPVAFFAGTWLLGNRAALGGGYHWAAPGYLFLFPLLGSALADPSRSSARLSRFWKLSVAAVCLLYVAFVSDVVGGWMATLSPEFRAHDPLTADQTDWWQLREVLAEKGMLDPTRYFLIAGRYELCFKAELVLQKSLPVVCLTSNPIGRTLRTDARGLLGHDAIIIASWWNAPQSIGSVEAGFAATEALPVIEMRSFGVARAQLNVLVGRNLLRSPLIGQPWPREPEAGRFARNRSVVVPGT